MKLAIVCAATILLSGCVSAAIGVTSAVVGGAVDATGAVVGGAVDVVTTSDEEQMKKDIEKMKRDRS